MPKFDRLNFDFFAIYLFGARLDRGFCAFWDFGYELCRQDLIVFLLGVVYGFALQNVDVAIVLRVSDSGAFNLVRRFRGHIASPLIEYI